MNNISYFNVFREGLWATQTLKELMFSSSSASLKYEFQSLSILENLGLIFLQCQFHFTSYNVVQDHLQSSLIALALGSYSFIIIILIIRVTSFNHLLELDQMNNL